MEDVRNLLHLADFEVVRARKHITLARTPAPGLAQLPIRYLAPLPLIRHLCLTSWIIARPLVPQDEPQRVSVSVICPCRNEAGNIEQIVNRLRRRWACRPS